MWWQHTHCSNGSQMQLPQFTGGQRSLNRSPVCFTEVQFDFRPHQPEAYFAHSLAFKEQIRRLASFQYQNCAHLFDGSPDMSVFVETENPAISGIQVNQSSIKQRQCLKPQSAVYSCWVSGWVSRKCDRSASTGLILVFRSGSLAWDATTFHMKHPISKIIKLFFSKLV